MTALAEALLDQLDADALAELAERLRPYLDRAAADELLTPAAAAARLTVHPKTLVRAAAAGRVPGAVRVGRAWRFHRDGLTLEPPAGIAAVPVVAKRRRTTNGTADAIRKAGSQG
jgi:excisionase family DNA binding protein